MSRRSASLPPILRGELHFAIGYSEPDAGTDLASLKTTAVRDGDDYVVNGTKVFTSWRILRTTSGWRHARIQKLRSIAGISMFLVPTDAPGLQVHAHLDDGRRAHERQRTSKNVARARRRT